MASDVRVGQEPSSHQTSSNSIVIIIIIIVSSSSSSSCSVQPSSAVNKRQTQQVSRSQSLRLVIIFPFCYFSVAKLISHMTGLAHSSVCLSVCCLSVCLSVVCLSVCPVWAPYSIRKRRREAEIGANVSQRRSNRCASCRLRSRVGKKSWFLIKNWKKSDFLDLNHIFLFKWDFLIFWIFFCIFQCCCALLLH